MQVGRLEVKQKKRGEKREKKTKVHKVRYLSSRPKVHVCIYTFRTMVRLVVVVVVVIHEPTTFLPSPSLSLSLYPRSIFHIHSSFKGKKDYLLLVLWAWGLV